MSEFSPFSKTKLGGKVDIYKGVTRMFGKPIEIKSKAHYQSLLKQHGMVDMSPKECLHIKPNKQSNARQAAKQLTKEIYERGAMPWVRGQVNRNGSDKLRR